MHIFERYLVEMLESHIKHNTWVQGYNVQVAEGHRLSRESDIAHVDGI